MNRKVWERVKQRCKEEYTVKRFITEPIGDFFLVILIVIIVVVLKLLLFIGK